MKPGGLNALIVWRDRKTGELRAAPTSVVWCHRPRTAGECYDLGVCAGVDDVMDGLTVGEVGTLVRRL